MARVGIDAAHFFNDDGFIFISLSSFDNPKISQNLSAYTYGVFA